jgi:hypothetical protein
MDKQTENLADEVMDRETWSSHKTFFLFLKRSLKMEDDKKHCGCFSTLTSPFCDKRNRFNQNSFIPYLYVERK